MVGPEQLFQLFLRMLRHKCSKYRFRYATRAGHAHTLPFIIIFTENSRWISNNCFHLLSMSHIAYSQARAPTHTHTRTVCVERGFADSVRYLCITNTHISKIMLDPKVWFYFYPMLKRLTRKIRTYARIGLFFHSIRPPVLPNIA